MKNTILTVSLILSIGSQAFAGPQPGNTANGVGHYISIANHTQQDMAYVVAGGPTNLAYAVKKADTDKYTTKGDKDVTFLIAKCNSKLASLCTDHAKLNNCVNNKRYVPAKVESLTINSETSCTVACTGGSATSCIIK